MIVLLLQKTSPSLRGELTRWLLEVKTGVFVGKVSGMVRDRLWEKATLAMGIGGVMMVYPADNEQGYAIRIEGDTSRTVRDIEGLSLVCIQ